MTQKVPPHDTEMEASLLGSLLVFSHRLSTELEQLSPSDFYKPTHANVFATMSRLHDGGDKVDTLTVRDGLRDEGLLKPGDREAEAYLVGLEAKAVAPDTAATYSAKLREKALARQAIAIAEKACAAIYKKGPRRPEP